MDKEAIKLSIRTVFSLLTMCHDTFSCNNIADLKMMAIKCREALFGAPAEKKVLFCEKLKAITSDNPLEVWGIWYPGEEGYAARFMHGDSAAVAMSLENGYPCDIFETEEDAMCEILCFNLGPDVSLKKMTLERAPHGLRSETASEPAMA